jgi:GNAT superfamily N-acetyltransferase
LRVEVREARPGDKAPLMSFIRDTWGGHDYIPYVWDAWMRDKDSKMFVVLADGRPVGMNRVCFLEDGSAWLEGARVHPDYRGMGLATALAEESMRLARRREVRVFRLTSGSRNYRAHRHIARIGFKEISRISVYVPSKIARPGPTRGVRHAGKDDEAAVTRMIRDSGEFRLGSGVMWDAFKAVALIEDTIDRALAAGEVYTMGKAVAITKPSGERNERWRQVCFVAGEGAGALQLIRHVFGRKEEFRTTWRLVYLPEGSHLIKVLREAGMVRHHSYILFERRAANG